MHSVIQRYLLPGLVFQGIVIGGGYATGRELVEFFLSIGPAAGLAGMGVAAVIWSLVMAVSFELCRMTASYDYRHFFQRLLGRAWFLYEVLLIALILASAFGIVSLIARGYGLLTFGFIAVFVVPVLTVGAWRVFGAPHRVRVRAA